MGRRSTRCTDDEGNGGVGLADCCIFDLENDRRRSETIREHAKATAIVRNQTEQAPGTSYLQTDEKEETQQESYYRKMLFAVFDAETAPFEALAP